MERDLEPADGGYVPCGVEQIAQDEARLRQGAGSGLGASLGLRALGHHLQSEPGLVEHVLQSIVTHADPGIAVSAASILAGILLDGVPQDQLVLPIAFPIAFAIPDDVDADDRAAWQENVKVASAFVSAHAARDAITIRHAASLERRRRVRGLGRSGRLGSAETGAPCYLVRRGIAFRRAPARRCAKSRGHRRKVKLVHKVSKDRPVFEPQLSLGRSCGQRLDRGR